MINNPECRKCGLLKSTVDANPNPDRVLCVHDFGFRVGFDFATQRFNAILALFIDFVEQENKRVDEEIRGIFRRDGGRQMQCSIFIKNLIEHITKEVVTDILSMKAEAHNEQERIIVGMLNDIVDLGEVPLNAPEKIRNLQFVKVYDIVKYAIKNNISLE